MTELEIFRAEKDDFFAHHRFRTDDEVEIAALDVDYPRIDSQPRRRSNGPTTNREEVLSVG